jgi:hypothetical protein
MSGTRKETPNAPQDRWVLDLPTARDLEWMEQGLCSKLGDPEDWYPDPNDWNSGLGSDVVAVCADCPVKAACLDYAMKLEVNQNGTPMSRSLRFGIYGGLTAPERARLAHGPVTPRDPDKPSRKNLPTCHMNHEWTEENTRFDSRGWRTCKTCERDRRRERTQRKRDEKAA